MISLNLSYLGSFWTQHMVETNLLIFLNVAGALALGLLLGYERAYHGRAAGMRTYGIVCMASAALTVFCGYPGAWWGGSMPSALPIDPSRVVQGIVTGVGFLGAGVIMKEGLNISGLTTAASIWASCAIGVLVGLGFFAASILLSVLHARPWTTPPRAQGSYKTTSRMSSSTRARRPRKRSMRARHNA